jgi:hypothetical protein
VETFHGRNKAVIIDLKCSSKVLGNLTVCVRCVKRGEALLEYCHIQCFS